jgi:hypothetical protein
MAQADGKNGTSRHGFTIGWPLHGAATGVLPEGDFVQATFNLLARSSTPETFPLL